MPERFLPLIPAGLLVQQILPFLDHIIIETRPGQHSAACPECGVPSERVHSLYGRTLGDLPWQGRAVTLRVRARRFRARKARENLKLTHYLTGRGVGR